MFSLFAALIRQLRNVFADRRDLLLENAALRQQLSIYKREGNRPRLISADPLFSIWLSRHRPEGEQERAPGDHFLGVACGSSWSKG